MQSIRKKYKSKPLRAIYFFYWILLAYILAAFVFWFVALSKQNVELSYYKLDMIDVDDALHAQKVEKIKSKSMLKPCRKQA